MDPFTERDIIDCLKSIAMSLRDIKIELADLNIAARRLIKEDPLNLGEDEDIEVEDDEEIIDPTVKFEVAEEDSIEDIETKTKDDFEEFDDSGDSEKIEGL